MKKTAKTYRYVVRVGPEYVHAGITDDLDGARIEANANWPKGVFFQVGDITTFDEARDWMTKNVSPSGKIRR
jgi:hypothetical protein